MESTIFYSTRTTKLIRSVTTQFMPNSPDPPRSLRGGRLHFTSPVRADPKFPTKRSAPRSGDPPKMVSKNSKPRQHWAPRWRIPPQMILPGHGAHHLIRHSVNVKRQDRASRSGRRSGKGAEARVRRVDGDAGWFRRGLPGGMSP